METKNIKRVEYTILNSLYKDNDVSIFLAENKGKKYAIYFFKNGFEETISKLKKIQKCGIAIPKIIANDKIEKILVREYFEEPNAFEVISKGELPEIYYKELFSIYRFCRFSKINLNYLPENFVLRGNKLYYLSDEIKDYEVKFNLENWGIYYWLYGEVLVNRLKANGYQIDKTRILSVPEENKKIVLMSVTYW